MFFPLLGEPLLSLELHLWNESCGGGGDGMKHTLDTESLPCRRRLIMAEAVVSSGYIRIEGGLTYS